MPLIEAALAFAITMLALSLVCSSLVEVIHRTLKLRETGLQYMLGQLFDQVLSKYLQPLIDKEKEKLGPNVPVNKVIESVRSGFIERMTANRAPVGLPPDPTLAAAPAADAAKPRRRPGNLWGGRHVTELSITDFMDRLGTIDVGAQIKTSVETAAGATAADAVDVVLKDIAQKFDGFGKDAGVYFEGRARMMSVVIAIVLAFVVHVDAVDLFRTYLRDPNARAKVIEQAQSVTAQYKASADAAEALKKLADANVAPPDAKDQFNQLKQAWNDALNNVTTTATQYADLGAPLGWTPERIKASGFQPLIWSCLDKATRESEGLGKLWHKCPDDDATGYRGAKGLQYTDIWFGLPTVPSAWLYLILGGLLIGLGSPFWYDVIANLTTLRNMTQTQAAAPPAAAAGPAAGAELLAAAPVDKAQPVTPVGAFHVSNKAAALTKQDGGRRQ